MRNKIVALMLVASLAAPAFSAGVGDEEQEKPAERSAIVSAARVGVELATLWYLCSFVGGLIVAMKQDDEAPQRKVLRRVGSSVRKAGRDIAAKPIGAREVVLAGYNLGLYMTKESLKNIKSWF